MEVDVEVHVFAGLQDGASGVEVEHAELTEHVNVVDPELSRNNLLLQPGKLDLQDVLGGFRHGFSSEYHTETSQVHDKSTAVILLLKSQ